MKTKATHPEWSELLLTAVNEPGTLSAAYSAFHNYSTGNQLLAMSQCMTRGIKIGPLATFPGWMAKDRHVRKGEKAIVLCQPITIKADSKQGAEQSTEESADECWKTVFTYKPKWFVLSQTDGEEIPAVEIPGWDKATALQSLQITEIEFDYPNGNCLGFARGRSIAINPVNPLPAKTTFHELAHVVLGHTEHGTMSDSEQLPRDEKELEAETVALLCLDTLGLPGQVECRGYIQNWWGIGNPIPEKHAQRILKAADTILKAGQPKRNPE